MPQQWYLTSTHCWDYWGVYARRKIWANKFNQGSISLNMIEKSVWIPSSFSLSKECLLETLKMSHIILLLSNTFYLFLANKKRQRGANFVLKLKVIKKKSEDALTFFNHGGLFISENKFHPIIWYKVAILQAWQICLENDPYLES